MRRPGYAGVNVTISWQVPPTVSVADSQDDVPLPLANSGVAIAVPVAPFVSTSTVFTVPAICAVTETFSAGAVVPTFCQVGKVAKGDCPCAPATTSPRAANASS